MAVFVFTILSACGKKGAPYPDEPSSFPQSYPRDSYEENGNYLDTEEPTRESI
ncbi:MAG: hypothetical protein WCG04_00510 [Alphaproteobacteria bacterium]